MTVVVNFTGGTKVGSEQTPQYLSETITKLNKFFIIDLDWIDIFFKINLYNQIVNLII